MVGGRSCWARQSYRLGDLDLKAASLDGYRQDWPISYKDLAPFYDIVEGMWVSAARQRAILHCRTGIFCRR